LRIFAVPIGAIEQRFQFRDIVRGEKPVSVVSRRQCEGSGGDRFDLMLLVGDLLALRCWIFFEQFRSPFTHDCLRCILTSSKPKTPRKSRIVIVDGNERDEGIFGIELLDLL
jgi:hypothetical protein